jgi:hypothetical protein
MIATTAAATFAAEKGEINKIVGLRLALDRERQGLII